MHRMVSWVFKFLGASLLMMFLFNTSLMILDTITVHSKVISLANVMVSEIAQNNCMPEDLADMFENDLLRKIDENSEMVQAIQTNLHSDLTVDGEHYTPLVVNEDDSSTLSNLKQYGQVQTLVISVTMDATEAYLRNGTNLEYTLDYVYEIPCLRYLK